MLQANYIAFVSSNFDISGLQQSKVIERNGNLHELVTFFAITANYQVELYHVEQGIQRFHLSQNTHYSFGPENCLIVCDINPNGRYIFA
jgi:hypothetical protein